ncbi:MAG: hypothetical protein M1815_000952 [Lichina confinis]|nr:MAG: hypothetical protein M1815_000952 [Lichina confinis]
MRRCRACNHPFGARSANTLPEYTSETYDGLPKKRGHIRLLHLKGSSRENPVIDCELQIVKIDTDKPPNPRYEALSWCWGQETENAHINIRKDGMVYAKYTSPNLVAALKVLRYPDRDRDLWIDAVCIDQSSPEEKNHQVEMMSDIYGRAFRVCIWLGDGDNASRMALSFIKDEVLQLQDFDKICGSEQTSEKWGALLDLMQRPWFSRRWVVQEIALARKAMVHCGADKISWKEFAIAVELFVEVETATHRLSEVMKKDPKFYHVPGWFEYVSALGASLLVEATGKLFRDYKPNGSAKHEYDSNSDDQPDADFDSNSEDDSDVAESAPQPSTKHHLKSRCDVPQPRQTLLSLEYLVSSLSIFEASVEHDAIYALLALARDTTPSAGVQEASPLSGYAKAALETFTQRKRYSVEYERPFVDVCKDFVQFCIENSDPTRALDILCRPWAPEEQKHKMRNGYPPSRSRGRGARARKVAAHGASTKRSSDDVIKDKESISAKESLRKIAKEKLLLPSWIPQLSGASYAMYSQAGVNTLKMGRKNADTLVGLPPSNQSLQRNYNAALSKAVDRKTLRFRRRLKMKHFSMYVQGFVLDVVQQVQPSSQGGAIPAEWARAGGWRNAPYSDPPDDFWRTIVADRGRDGRNPPVYYSRACKESFSKGGLQSGSVNTTDLINNERCSVVAQFCRRVQAVIWNRSLIKTRTGKLGLASQNVQPDDLVCILYGCSVPVILRARKKTAAEVDQEVEEEENHWGNEIQKCLRRNESRVKTFRKKKESEKVEYAKWESSLRKNWLEDKDWRKIWREKVMSEWSRAHKTTGMESARQAACNSSPLRVGRPERVSSSQEQVGSTAATASDDETPDTLPFSEPQDIAAGPAHQAKASQLLPSWHEIVKEILRRAFKDYIADKRQEAKPNNTDWKEPRINWHEFEIQLKYGRFWKKWYKQRKAKLANESTERRGENLIQMDLTTSTDIDRSNSSPRVASEKTQALDSLRTLSKDGQQYYLTRSPRSGVSRVVSSGAVAEPVPNSCERPRSAPEKEEERQQGSAYITELKAHLKEKFEKKECEDEDTSPEDKDRDEADDRKKADRGRVDAHNKRVEDNWSHYELLGECYIHTMMDGEAMAEQNEKAIRPQVFELR